VGPVVFDFRMYREREGSKRFLGNFEGILQTDGYGAYDHVGGAGIVHAACLGTCQAKVLRGAQTQSKDQSSIGIVAQMDELFAIDGQAREQGLTHRDRQVLRLQKARPLLEQIKMAMRRLVSMRCPRALWPRLATTP
jgi:transposase